MNLLQYIQTHLGVELHSNAALPFALTEHVFTAGQIITHYNKNEINAYFLKTGIIQISLLHHGAERILDFIFENNFFGAYTSLLTHQPSDVQITALTRIEVEVIPYSSLQQAYKTSLLANQLGRFVTERTYVNNTRREKDFLTKTAEERYLELLHKRPDIISIIPVHKIARYLGIHPESLSRIRKSIIS